MNRVDLHIHSNGSHDGEFGAREIVQMAARKGLKAISVTDHNTVINVKEALETGEEIGVEVLPGIEIECAFEERVLHVLGYMIDSDSPDYAELETVMAQRERNVSVRRIELLKGMGLPIEVEDVEAIAQNGMFTGPIIANALFSKPEARTHPLLARYFNGESHNPLSDFYWDFIAQGCPAYVPAEYFSLKEIVELIHRTGGVSVLAHPGAVIGDRPETLEGIAGEGVRGVEVYCSYHSKQEAALYLRRTLALGLIPTLGSDFHGYVKPGIKLGECGYDGDGLDLLSALKEAKGSA